MSLLKSLFRKRQRSLDDPDFGLIEEDKPGSWNGQAFRLWEYSSIQVMLDGNEDGPTPAQRSFIKTLREDAHGVRTRIEGAITERAKDTTSAKGPLTLTSIYLPKAPPDEMWRVWYDMEGENHYWYGAEIEGWQHIVPFTED